MAKRNTENLIEVLTQQHLTRLTVREIFASLTPEEREAFERTNVMEVSHEERRRFVAGEFIAD